MIHKRRQVAQCDHCGADHYRLSDYCSVLCYLKGKSLWVAAPEGSGLKTPCWILEGKRQKRQYPCVQFKGRNRAAHRVSWELFNGMAPDPEMEIDHLCSRRACVQPRHLEQVTPQENSRRTFRRGNGVTPMLHGEAHPRSRLKERNLSVILDMRAKGLSFNEIGALIGVNASTARRAAQGISWHRVTAKLGLKVLKRAARRRGRRK